MLSLEEIKFLIEQVNAGELGSYEEAVFIYDAFQRKDFTIYSKALELHGSKGNNKTFTECIREIEKNERKEK